MRRATLSVVLSLSVLCVIAVVAGTAQTDPAPAADPGEEAVQDLLDGDVIAAPMGSNVCPEESKCEGGCVPAAGILSDLGYSRCEDGTPGGFTCGHGQTVHQGTGDCVAPEAQPPYTICFVNDDWLTLFCG